MAEYIDREALYEKAYWHGEHPDVDNPFPDGVDAIDIKDVDAIPAADVAPVVRTRWAHLGGDEWCCPVCGFALTTEGSWDKPTKKYCEDCGAKMDGGDSDEVD